jgi:Na+/H+ antiporter NhaC
MASAGAQCDHIKHVSTQLPYALTAAVVSCVAYIAAGFIRNWFVSLIIGVAFMICTLFVIRSVTTKK